MDRAAPFGGTEPGNIKSTHCTTSEFRKVTELCTRLGTWWVWFCSIIHQLQMRRKSVVWWYNIMVAISNFWVEERQSFVDNLFVEISFVEKKWHLWGIGSRVGHAGFFWYADICVLFYALNAHIMPQKTNICKSGVKKYADILFLQILADFMPTETFFLN